MESEFSSYQPAPAVKKPEPVMKKCAVCGESKESQTAFYPKLNKEGRIPTGGGDRLDECIDCVDAKEAKIVKEARKSMNEWRQKETK